METPEVVGSVADPEIIVKWPDATGVLQGCMSQPSLNRCQHCSFRVIVQFAFELCTPPKYAETSLNPCLWTHGFSPPKNMDTLRNAVGGPFWGPQESCKLPYRLFTSISVFAGFPERYLKVHGCSNCCNRGLAALCRLR